MTVEADPIVAGPAPSGLRLAQHLVAGPLRRAVDRLHPDLARVCGYHFGWCAASGEPTGAGTGKLLRAGLAVLAAQGTGVDLAAAVPGAVAVELIHNFSLIHDDIMDGDERRRGRPSAWVVFGPGLATLAGDALVAAAFDQLTGVAGEPGWRAWRLLADALRRMIDGQAADLALERCEPATVDRYLRATDKTTALLEAATAIGVVLGGATGRRVQPLLAAGRNLGLAWQVANDVEDIWGDPVATGKPARSDLGRSKKTMPVILALASSGPAAAELAVLLADPDRTEPALAAQAALIERAGGRAEAERLSARYLDAALAAVAGAGLLPEVRTQLSTLFRIIVGRAG